MSYKAYYIDSERFFAATGLSLDTLHEDGVLDDFTTPTETERRLLVLLRTGSTEQREKALAALRNLYIK